MIHPIRTWNRFFFGMTSARPLGLIRVGFGLLALANLALCAVDLDHWWTDAGLLRGDEQRVLAGAWLLSPLHYIQTPLAARVAFGFTALAALGLTVGWRTKLMSILFYGGMLSIHNRNTVSCSGADVLLMVFAFNLMLSPCGAACSVDSWLARRRRGGSAAEPIILLWPYRLFQFQSSLIYGLAAILKCGGNLWLNGSALHFVLNNTEVRRFDVSFLSSYPILINLMTYSALAFEFSLAFFIWVKAVRPAVIAAGIMLHLGILATINIPIFGELMWLGYLAFLTPPEFQSLIRAVDVRDWFRRTAPVAAEAPGDAPTIPRGVANTASGRPVTIRIDRPEPLPAPHSDRPPAARELPSEREYAEAEAAIEPWDSIQILL